MTTVTTLRWGILGPGNIAKKFASSFSEVKHGRLVAVGSRTLDKAQAFAKEFKIERAHGSYEALLADPDVDAVYIANPHPHHPQWVIAACEAGKHVLCEKPIALNSWQTEAMIQAARENDVFLMEAFMYRCHPQTARVVELIQSGAIGAVRAIRASFGFCAGFNPTSRLFSNALGGGGIMDVGCYPVSFARLIAGAATGSAVAEPTKVVGSGHLGESNVDEYASAVLHFPGDIIAEVSTGVRLNRENDALIIGTEGTIHLNHPWQHCPNADAKIVMKINGKDAVIEATGDKGNAYAFEIDRVAMECANRQASFPAMSWDDSLGQMRTLDKWRQAVGLTFEGELPASAPARGGKLSKQASAKMTYAQVPGLNKKVSRLVLGCDNQNDYRHGAAVWDDFYQRGGTAFDTGFIYGGGSMEKNLGQWMEIRGIRDEMSVIVKGGHTPMCYPEAISQQLNTSLERLRTSYADIYMMHRDNLEVPVSEFIDSLNDHVKAGRIKVFGGSNWSIERVAEANAYAAKKGLQGFQVLSNNFSLARMVDPVWRGCVSASDKASRDFLAKNNIALMPWSSQARGFFLRADPAFTSDEELTRCWYADDNFKRLERARVLAKEKGVLPIQIALAYVLNQPFPTFPLIGPRQISETHSSMQGLSIALTTQELAFLNLEADSAKSAKSAG